MAHASAAVESSTEQQTDDGKLRELSTIAFPYLSLNDGVEIAQAVYTLGGTATYEQIAGHLQSTTTSSSFRTRISTGKVFGLISTEQGSVHLTPLGSRICDSQQEKAARAEAFLAVPLYKEVYEKYKSVQLPPSSGLENFIGSVGVAPKQRERARQILIKSAQEAGFFQFGKDRLIFPPNIKANASPVAVPTEEPEQPEKKNKPKDRDEDEDSLHPFIKGLLTKLPKPDDEWPQENRAKWLETAANIFDLLYKNSDDNNRVISIKIEKDSAK
jgi:hypothetical protein